MVGPLPSWPECLPDTLQPPISGQWGIMKTTIVLGVVTREYTERKISLELRLLDSQVRVSELRRSRLGWSLRA